MPGVTNIMIIPKGIGLNCSLVAPGKRVSYFRAIFFSVVTISLKRFILKSGQCLRRYPGLAR